MYVKLVNVVVESVNTIKTHQFIYSLKVKNKDIKESLKLRYEYEKITGIVIQKVLIRNSI